MQHCCLCSSLFLLSYGVAYTMIINLLRRLLESRELHKILHCSTFTSIDHLLLISITFWIQSKHDGVLDRSLRVGAQAQFTLQQTIQRMNTCNSYNNHWQLYRNTAFQWSLDFPLRSETDPFCVPVQNF